MRLLALAFLGLLSVNLEAQSAFEKDLQTRLILAEDGDVIELPEGRFELSGTISLDGKKDIQIIGKGQAKTFLSWKKQIQGAEGIKITNCERVRLADFSAEDAKGDLIKTQLCRDIAFEKITVEWTGRASKKNGAYGLYPVQCEGVRIIDCTAIGASDAGIYVGQSDRILVDRCTARRNVAGIEIENSTNAVVQNCLATENTGGILVFDLPDLVKKRGGNILIRNNQSIRNNHKNFAPRGNTVGKVPPGTGLMILATSGVEFVGNHVEGNRTASLAIASYFITETPIHDASYEPHPSAIYVHDNVFSKGRNQRMRPALRNKLGLLFFLKFGRRVPHILWDGIQKPEWTAPDGSLKPERNICLGPNENGSFVNLRADKKFKNMRRDRAPHDCQIIDLPSKNELWK